MPNIRPAAGAIAASIAVAASGNPIEHSDDARTTAAPATHAPTAYSSRGSTLPFGSSPDYQIDLRRQVGGLAIADMNNDGLNDLVAVCYISSSFPPYEDWREMIFFNSPSGLETTPSWVSTNETHTGDVQVGDLNNDGHQDLVAIRGGGVRSDAVQVYFGSPSGPETTPSYSSNIPGRAWGTSGELLDIDNDGDLDLATTNQGLSPDPFRPVMLFRNDGSGLAAAPDWTSANDEISNGIASADLLGSDGLPELVVAKWVNFNSAVYENNAGTPNGFPFMQVATTGTDKSAAVGDVDGDGFPEVAFGGSPTTIYQAVHGFLSPAYTSNPPFSGPQEIRLHDADGDGDLDLAEVHFSDGRAHIYQNNAGTLDTTPTWTFDAPEVGNAIVFGDLNNDGRDDLAVGYSGNTCIRVFYAEANGCPADINGDGVADLADINAFITAFLDGEPEADLAPPFGVLDLADLQAFVASFNAGCP